MPANLAFVGDLDAERGDQGRALAYRFKPIIAIRNPTRSSSSVRSSAG